MANPRDLDVNLVDAQETRRILDRLYGYEVSPVLWKKVMPRLSAGRVQSVATRLVVDRERERMAFRTASLLGHRRHPGRRRGGRAAAVRRPGWSPSVINGSPRAATSTAAGSLQSKGNEQLIHLDEAAADVAGRGAAQRRVHASRTIESKQYTRRPYAPVPHHDACSRRPAASSASPRSGRCRWRSTLYEAGFITYMRTDSVSCPTPRSTPPATRSASCSAPQYLPGSPRVYTSKVKNAQEAHEAIRPAGETFRTPAQTGLRGDEFRLYELIWMRTIASQMSDAEGEPVTVQIDAPPAGREPDEPDVRRSPRTPAARSPSPAS